MQWSHQISTPVALAFLALLTLQAEGLRTYPERQGIVFSTNDDSRIYFTAGGTGTRSLVFLHGWTCNRRNWEFQLKSFASQYRVVALDFAGHGESDADRKEYRMQSFAADVVSVLELLDLNDAVLVAHSMAGAVALETALLAPERIRAIVGVDNFKDRGFRYTDKQIEDFNRPLKKDYESAMRQISARMFHHSTDGRLVKRISEEMARTPRDVAISAYTMANRYTSEDLDPALKKLSRPLYLINSDRSPTLSSKFTPLLPEYYPVIMRGTGHFPMLEHPVAFDQELRKILSRLSF